MGPMRKFFRRHTWEAVAITPVKMTDIYTNTQRPATRVLYRRDDGKTRSVRLDGDWTLEQVKGTRP